MRLKFCRPPESSHLILSSTKNKGREAKADTKNQLPLGPTANTDTVEIRINNIIMWLRREISLMVPFEVHVLIPKAEIRKRCYENGQLVSEDETILNSISIVHSPQHPPAGEQPPSGQAME